MEVNKKKKRIVPESLKMVQAQTAKAYSDAWEAKRKGRPVGWSTAIFPQEVCETFGVPVLYPENNAASVSARHLGDKFIEHAEGEMNYPINICSYARLNMGMADIMKKGDYEPFEPAMPLPDFLLLANNSCTQLMKWYECLARDLNIPIFFVDCLFNYDNEEPSDHCVKYGRSQIENYIKGMEEFLGEKLDWDKFLKVQEISQKNRILFNEIVAMNSATPSPLNGFDLFSYMASLVICRGKDSTTEIFKQLKKEIEGYLEKGISTFPAEEEYRIHWEGIACWPNLGYNLKTLKKYGINAVMNGYVTAWDVEYEPGDMDSMAKAYQTSSTNSFNAKCIMDKRIKSIDKFSCEGMLSHVNRSCKVMTSHIFVGREMVEDNVGIPCVNFDGDQSDSRIFNEAQFETRLQGLVEIMKTNKEAINV